MEHEIGLKLFPYRLKISRHPGFATVSGSDLIDRHGFFCS